MLLFSGCYGEHRHGIDPGPKRGAAQAGQPIEGLTADQLKLFQAGLRQFSEHEPVSGGAGTNGLGPRYNADGCVSCHSQPAVGGSSPVPNPAIEASSAGGATNSIPGFERANGPIKEVRFQADGGVHDLFTIVGRTDTSADCRIAPTDFNRKDLRFRIPTPLFGLGLLEAVPDSEIVAKNGGRPNHSGNDGTTTRFGWKAQNKSLIVFAGEAYNVEVGITNPLFPQERDETPACNPEPSPNDIGPNSDTEEFANFMRFLAPPTPYPHNGNGDKLFEEVGCASCHTPQLTTGGNQVDALSNKTFAPFTDMLLHRMGKLGDGIPQGEAKGDEFRTAPLWGLSQRLFFLHDGRTGDLYEAIEAHKSRHSQANTAVNRFNHLTAKDQQELLNYLRTL